MQGTFRVNKRVARVTLRIEITDPAAALDVTDVMLQPGNAASGFLPHVSELPWSAGVSA
ncbi:hypothetical protein [Microbacterium caowuchunii]|uniref:hypothetical protein n=1 Tax=Microbacterium caowuchunii TaxID=2614638 RepID=UPI0017828806|nr:hypothetical protein [Microbacterium caowuchunii]